MPDDWLLLSNINHMIGGNRSDWQLPSNRGQSYQWLQLLKSDLKMWTALLAIEVMFGHRTSPEISLKKNFIRRLRTRDMLGVLNFCDIYVLEK